MVVIVVLITIKFGEVKDLVSYISFGLALTSLFVGLIAIFQTFFSSSAIDKSVGNLDESSQMIVSNSTRLETIITSLDGKLTELPTYFKNLETKIGEANQAAKSNPETPKAKPTHFSKEMVDYFLRRISAVGMMALYICFLANKTRKQVPKDFFVDEAFGMKYEYCFGFIIASVSIGILEATQKENEWIVSKFNEGFNEMERFVKEFGEKNQNKFEPNYTRVKNKIDDFFKQI